MRALTNNNTGIKPCDSSIVITWGQRSRPIDNNATVDTISHGLQSIRAIPTPTAEAGLQCVGASPRSLLLVVTVTVACYSAIMVSHPRY